jgi:hypothetical protein
MSFVIKRQVGNKNQIEEKTLSCPIKKYAKWYKDHKSTDRQIILTQSYEGL